MKKICKTFLCILAMILLFNTDCCFADNGFSLDVPYTGNNKIGEIAAYISKDDPEYQEFYDNWTCDGYNKMNCYYFTDSELFKEFLETPNEEFLKSVFDMSDKVIVLEFMQKELTQNGMRLIHINDPQYLAVYDDADFISSYNSYKFLYSTNFESIEKDNLKTALCSFTNDYNIETISTNIIINEDYPAVIMINTADGYYFWVYENLDENKNTAYSLYTIDDFTAKARQCYADWYIGENKVGGDDNIILRWNKPFLKITSFIDYLGGTNIKWNSEAKSIEFYLNGDKIEIFTCDYDDIQHKNKGNTRYYKNDMPFINGNTIRSVRPVNINGYFYYNIGMDSYFCDFLKKYNINSEVNADKKTVVWNIGQQSE